MRAKTLIPFAIFCAIVALLLSGLGKDPGHVPSPFIGKAAPDFELPRLMDTPNTVSRDDLLGQVWLLNVWASWCAACLDEHPVLLDYEKRQSAPIIGLNYKDSNDDALAWLRRLDNPYAMVAVDQSGDTGIDYGVYGVPETFVVDKSGTIRLKHIGPVTRTDLDETIAPLVAALQGETQ